MTNDNTEIVYTNSDGEPVRKVDVEEAKRHGWTSKADIDSFIHGWYDGFLYPQDGYDGEYGFGEHNRSYEDGYAVGIQYDNNWKHKNGWFNVSDPDE